MKTVIWIFVVILVVTPAFAQSSGRSGMMKVVNWSDDQDQSSGLDLLQQATKGTSLSVGRVEAAPEPVQSQKPSSTQETKTDSSSQTQQTAAQEAQPAQPAMREQKIDPAVAAAAASPTTLDIPLEMGSSASVQTTVKPLSPKASARVQQAKERLDAQKAAAKTPQEATPATPSPDGQTQLTDEEAEEAAADAELEYAVRMLERSKAEAATGRKIPPSAAKNRPATVPSATKKFNPNAFRPGVEWAFSKSKHFDIYTQKSTSSIGSANMAMMFEGAYETLHRFIPWMMSQRVRVFVYEDHNSYLKYEPEAKAWTRALAYPTRGEIVVYDEPEKRQELKEVFTHELTHIFTQSFFDKHHTGRIMTPTWLDEGLAVLVEDQAYNNGRGGPWNHDLQTLNLQRDPSQQTPSFGSKSMFGAFGKKSPFSSRGPARPGFRREEPPVYLTPFDAFMEEGSLDAAQGQDKTQKWYLQAYLMVRFLLNPAGGSSPSNRIRFEQFTRLLAEGEPVRNPSTGFLVKDAKGNTVYRPYSSEKALARSYNYNTIANFEDNFWRWVNK